MAGLPEVDDQPGATVDIGGLAAKWEACRDTRFLLHKSGSIIESEPGKYHPSDNVAGVGVNIRTLMPLMPMLWQSNPNTGGASGYIGMVTIPAVEEQFLIQLWFKVVSICTETKNSFSSCYAMQVSSFLSLCCFFFKVCFC